MTPSIVDCVSSTGSSRRSTRSAKSMQASGNGLFDTWIVNLPHAPLSKSICVKADFRQGGIEWRHWLWLNYRFAVGRRGLFDLPRSLHSYHERSQPCIASRCAGRLGNLILEGVGIDFLMLWLPRVSRQARSPSGFGDRPFVKRIIKCVREFRYRFSSGLSRNLNQ